MPLHQINSGTYANPARRDIFEKRALGPVVMLNTVGDGKEASLRLVSERLLPCTVGRSLAPAIIFIFIGVTMNTCNTCRETKHADRFSLRVDTGKRKIQCRQCEYKLRDLRRKANLKADSAKSLARYGVKTGKIKVVDKCESCGSEGKLQKHHKDYNKPYDVIWLCLKCHARLHVEKRKSA